MKACHRLMVRLLEEQCEVEDADAPKMSLKNPKDIPGNFLQNPSDPDATYGHKGKEYKASLTETLSDLGDFLQRVPADGT